MNFLELLMAKAPKGDYKGSRILPECYSSSICSYKRSNLSRRNTKPNSLIEQDIRVVDMAR